MALIIKRKRMMDLVGHYARPELLSLIIDNRPARPMERSRAAMIPSPNQRTERDPMTSTMPTALPTEQLINELQSFGAAAR